MQIDIATLISIIIGLVSLIINIIQYNRADYEKKNLKVFLDKNYNNFQNIARIISRIGFIYDEKNKTENEKLVKMFSESQIIRGIADALRYESIIFSKEHLGFTPRYTHPAFPSEEMPNEVILGDLPDELYSSKGHTTVGKS